MMFPTVVCAAAGLLTAWLTVAAYGETDPKPSRETILFIRHGEKPAKGLGQLNCAGLNRAIALPGVLKAKYGHIDAVFAPNPSHQKDDDGTDYDYVRPLATVEPAAIRFGLPVQTTFGYKQIDKLREALAAPAYRDATVLVGWEHHKLRDTVLALVAGLGGDTTPVPDWPANDFDSIWQVTIVRTGDQTKVAFARDKEGLDDQPAACPT